MKRAPTVNTLKRLEGERNCWLSTVRPNGKPHLVPVWVVWHDETFYIGMKGGSVKARNLRKSPHASLSLEDGSDVVICEGDVAEVVEPYSAEMLQKFRGKYDWDIPSDDDYGLIVCLTPTKWLIWGDEGNE